MTRIEEFWEAFKARTLPPQIPPTPLYAMTQAYHRGAYDMLAAVNEMQARNPQEARDYLEALELYCRSVLDQPRGKVQ